jgi:hypothetical protein
VRKGSKRVYEFWDAYDNEEIMVLDEYNKAYMDYADLNGLADTDCDLRIPATGGSATRHVTFKMLFVFSNNSIVRLYPREDEHSLLKLRFHEINLEPFRLTLHQTEQLKTWTENQCFTELLQSGNLNKFFDYDEQNGLGTRKTQTERNQVLNGIRQSLQRTMGSTESETSIDILDTNLLDKEDLYSSPLTPIQKVNPYLSFSASASSFLSAGTTSGSKLLQQQPQPLQLKYPTISVDDNNNQQKILRRSHEDVQDQELHRTKSPKKKVKKHNQTEEETKGENEETAGNGLRLGEEEIQLSDEPPINQFPSSHRSQRFKTTSILFKK